MVKKERGINIISLNDLHVPFQDPKAVKIAFNFCQLLQPEYIIMHEWNDFYAISKFDKDPKRISSLQDELDEVYEHLVVLKKLCPKSKLIMIDSNHTDRLKKYLWSQAPGLESLRSLKLPELLRLKELGIMHSPYWLFRDFMFKHGDIIRELSSYTARGELEREGTSGASGHTHRLGAHYTTKRGGEYVWIEGGCLCSKDAEYISGVANWQHGLTHVKFKKDSPHFIANALPIVDYELMFGDLIITE